MFCCRGPGLHNVHGTADFAGQFGDGGAGILHDMPALIGRAIGMAGSLRGLALRATSCAVAVISCTAVATSSISASCVCTPLSVRMAMSAVCSDASLTFCTEPTTR